MRLVNEKTNKSYDARVLSDTKVPKFVRGEYVDQKINVNGKPVNFKYDKQRKTGLYFQLDGKNLYFAERDILVEKTLKIGPRANAAEVKEVKEVKTKKTSDKVVKQPKGEE